MVQRESRLGVDDLAAELDLIKESLYRLLPLEVERFRALTLDSEIRRLGLDSLVLLEMVMWLEDRIRRPVDERELSKARTLGDIAVLVRAERRAACPTPGSS
jgi:acyl carrier protein